MVEATSDSSEKTVEVFLMPIQEVQPVLLPPPKKKHRYQLLAYSEAKLLAFSLGIGKAQVRNKQSVSRQII